MIEGTVVPVVTVVKVADDNYTVTLEDGSVFTAVKKSELQLLKQTQQKNADISQEYITKYTGAPEYIDMMFTKVKRDDIINANTVAKTKYDNAVIVISAALLI